MKYKVYNQKGKEVGEASLPDDIFMKKINRDLLHQVVVSQMSKRRQVSAHTKGRGEVSGGGRKPWRQKGTGRARHGSIRSPLWKGGGVTFGPRKDVNYNKKIPRKMRRGALFMVLSAKAKQKLLILLDKLELEGAKTKLMAEILKNLPSGSESSLLALPLFDKKVIQSGRNIPQLKIMQARELNCLDLMSFKYLIMPKESIKVIEKTFLKPNNNQSKD